MSAGELGVLIPIVALCIPIVKIWTTHRQKLVEMQLQGNPEQSAEQAAHSRELEDRVRVLERIITDRGFDVATQIEALRDSRKTEALLDRSEQELRP